MISTGIRLSMRALLLLLLFELLLPSNSEGIKRVPQGFMGMRGKKDIDYDGFYEKRKQGFVGVKGKKDFYDLYYPEVYYKRAPTGFVGMRGKKYDPYDLERYSAECVPKRGSILGQIDYDSSEEAGDFSILNDLIEKYLESNENQISENTRPDLTKRSAQMNQFFGMRGKKSETYRGNKRPFDLSFRGKFVGVRGKKSVGEFEKRKIPADAFVGMRGKKENYDESAVGDVVSRN